MSDFPKVLAAAIRWSEQNKRKVHVYQFRAPAAGFTYWVWHPERACHMRAHTCPFSQSLAR